MEKGWKNRNYLKPDFLYNPSYALSSSLPFYDNAGDRALARAMLHRGPIVGVLGFFAILAIDVQRRLEPGSGVWDFHHPVVITGGIVVLLIAMAVLLLSEAWSGLMQRLGKVFARGDHISLPLCDISRSLGMIMMVVAIAVSAAISLAGYLDQQVPERGLSHPLFVFAAIHVVSIYLLMFMSRPRVIVSCCAGWQSVVAGCYSPWNQPTRRQFGRIKLTCVY